MAGESSTFGAWFESTTGRVPHPWQGRLGSDASCRDRLIRIPTGFGKTAGTILPWLYHRVQRADLSWPTRLAFCLPMRTLVEQTEREVQRWLAAAMLESSVAVHVLMGGIEAARWRLMPERPAILVGTQDMLLSRALNRGYGCARAAWPMEFGLLHHDCLWIFDEIQLQDVGLATSAQLAAFRAQDQKAGRTQVRATYTWWMSATLQSRWLETVDHAAHVPDLANRTAHIDPQERTGGLWAIRKPLRRVETAGIVSPEALAKLLKAEHRAKTLTLCVVNTVDRAAKTFEALEALLLPPKGKGKSVTSENSPPDLRLVHSRFRGAERRGWASAEDGFLLREAKVPEGGRIVVATQVVEAGIDVSAMLLVTDLAPWPSLVQRFGRCARYADGIDGTLIVAGGPIEDEKKARPYDPAALSAAADALDRLIASAQEGSPGALESFEASLDEAARGKLYPYEPPFVLRRRELDALFDTSRDLGGADLDIGRFIRSGDDRDAQVLWRSGFVIERPETHPRRNSVSREELCPVPLAKLRELLETRDGFAFDYLDGEWTKVDPRRLYPGLQVLLHAEAGGYVPRTGIDLKSKLLVPSPRAVTGVEGNAEALEEASWGEDDEALSRAEWKTIAVHGHEVAVVLRRMMSTLGLSGELSELLTLAARWHDAGKGHEHFQRAIKDTARMEEGGIAVSRELAKAPDGAWRRPQYPDRPGLRHELASTLVLFELLRRVQPDHPALLGPHAALFEAIGTSPLPVADADRLSLEEPLTAELCRLDADGFNLLAFLVCAHHGKVRCSLSTTPKDQESGRNRINGIEEGDVLPSIGIALGDGTPSRMPSLTLSLAPATLGVGELYGASWSERVGALLSRYGPFTLAYLETLLRSADCIASGSIASSHPRARS